MTGIVVLVVVLVLLSTRTRKQRRAWRRVLAGVWWLLLLPLALLVPGPKKPLRKRAAASGGAVLPRSAPRVAHDLDPVFLPRSRRPLLKRKYAAGDDRPGQGPRYFTKEQKAELLRIANNQCQRVTAGWRCTARTNLKADHKVPYSWGGLTTIRNGQILCGHHNDSKGAHFADPGGESLPPPWLRSGRRRVVRN